MKELQWLLQNGWVVSSFSSREGRPTFQYENRWCARGDSRMDCEVTLAKQDSLDTLELSLKWLSAKDAREISCLVHSWKG